jgi:hypothetical protein
VTATATWLSPEWFDRFETLAGDRIWFPGVSARIQVEVTGGPEGEVRYYRVVEDGRLTHGATGKVDDPDITLTWSWADAVAASQGELDPNVAFMQGRMKAAGSTGQLLKLLPVARTKEWQTLQRSVASITAR